MKKLIEQRSQEGDTNSMFGGTCSSKWIYKEFYQFEGESGERSEWKK